MSRRRGRGIVALRAIALELVFLLLADPVALLAVAVLVGLGVLNLFAVGDSALAVHQLLAAGIGLALLAVLRRVPARRQATIAFVAYVIACGLLALVLAAGVQANGARRWLVIGPLVLQPSELAKVALLLALAQLLGAGPRVRPGRVAAALALAALPICLTLLQPDLSTSVLLALLTLAALLIARVRLPVVLGITVAGAVAAPLAVRLLRPYQMARLQAFLGASHHSDMTGSGWSLLQAHVAIASGGLFGISHQPLHLLMAAYLPARQTDLAFSSLVEQWGALAGVAAIVATLLLVMRLLDAARVARTRQGLLLGSGLAMLLAVEAAVSLAGNLGALPLAGVPYPLLSYGGTTAAAHLAALGLVLGTRRDAAERSLWLPPRWLRPRPRLIRLVGAVSALQLTLLSALAWQIQTVEGGSLRQIGASEMQRCVRIPAARGAIVDRHGAVLASNSDLYEVHAFPQLIAGDPMEVSQLAGVLGLKEGSLAAQLRAPASGLETRLAVVPAATAQRVGALNLTGVFVVPAPRRTYPYGALLGPLLGYIGVATPADMRRNPSLPLGAVVGRAGLELQYDDLLRGLDGRQCVYVDPAGRPASLGDHTDPVPGADLMLTLDLGLQQQADARLQDRLRGSHSDLGAAVVMDPRDGQLLAMASRPSFDNSVYTPPIDGALLNALAAAPGHPMLEHATQVASPPGSTFKLVVAAAGLAYSAVDPNAYIPTGYWFNYGNVAFHGWGYLPAQNLAQAIAWSNDVYFYKLALTLGPERIKDVATQVGAGVPTGVDLPGEAGGLVGTPESVAAAGGTWYPGNAVIMGIGQGYVTATPLQDLRWASAVSTGLLVTPHFGLAYRLAGASAWQALPAPAALPLPFRDRLGPIREGMREAVTVGVDPEVNGLPAPAGAKTGTAEDPSTPSGDADSWFDAVMPYSAPEVAALVFARGGGQGYMSGEAVKQILAYYWSHRSG